MLKKNAKYEYKIVNIYYIILLYVFLNYIIYIMGNYERIIIEDLFLKICKLIFFFFENCISFLCIQMLIIYLHYKITNNFIPVSNQDVFFKYSSLNNLNCNYSNLANDLL